MLLLLPSRTINLDHVVEIYMARIDDETFALVGVLPCVDTDGKPVEILLEANVSVNLIQADLYDLTEAMARGTRSRRKSVIDWRNRE